MRELNRILELWHTLEEAGESAVLATVVRTQGSSYRLPGARLLLSPDGRHAGSISGGCLEEDILKKAWWLTADGPVLRRYDTSPDGEIAAGGFGLGCNGVIHVLLERIVSGPSILSVLEKVKEVRRAATVAHILRPATAVGQRLVIDVDGNLSHDIAIPELARILVEGYNSGSNEHLQALELPPGVEAFLENLTPPVHLLVFGAGDDAVSLTQLAKYLGWQVSVLDGRSHYARKEKFPLADHVWVRKAGSPAPPIDPWTVAVIMTHSFSQDLDVLQTLASQPLRYLGLLGPRKRTDQLVAEAGLDGTEISSSLHTPVGLDIGADGPEQVALSVTAEIQSVLNGRVGGFLSNRNGPIHAGESSEEEAANWVRSIVCA
ncbi:MAG: XdhC family protein [Acidobacteriota bacterium]|nr:XdhC family protein [Acidobacteriota bacterium]